MSDVTTLRLGYLLKTVFDDIAAGKTVRVKDFETFYGIYLNRPDRDAAPSQDWVKTADQILTYLSTNDRYHCGTRIWHGEAVRGHTEMATVGKKHTLAALDNMSAPERFKRHKNRWLSRRILYSSDKDIVNTSRDLMVDSLRDPSLSSKEICDAGMEAFAKHDDAVRGLHNELGSQILDIVLDHVDALDRYARKDVLQMIGTLLQSRWSDKDMMRANIITRFEGKQALDAAFDRARGELRATKDLPKPKPWSRDDKITMRIQRWIRMDYAHYHKYFSRATSDAMIARQEKLEDRMMKIIEAAPEADIYNEAVSLRSRVRDVLKKERQQRSLDDDWDYHTPPAPKNTRLTALLGRVAAAHRPDLEKAKSRPAKESLSPAAFQAQIGALPGQAVPNP